MTDLRLNRISVENNQLLIQRGNVLISSTQSNSLVSYGGLIIANTENSTSITQGSVVISGGLAIRKNVFIGDSLIIDSVSSIFSVSGLIQNRLYLGSTSLPEFSVTPNGIDRRFFLNDYNLSINFTQASTNASSGAFVVNGGGVSINTTTNSLNWYNGGAMTIAGGISIGKDTYINGQTFLNDTLNIGSGKIYTTNGNLSIENNSLTFNTVNSIKSIVGNKTVLDISNQNTIINNELLITNTENSVNSSSGSIVSYGGISINNTTNSTSITGGGALTIAGGMSVVKDTFLNKLNVIDIHFDSGTSLFSSIGNLLLNSTNDFIYNTDTPFKISKNGSLVLSGYTFSSTANSLLLVNNSGNISNLNLYNSSTDNSRDTSINIESLKLGYNGSKYNINCVNNSLYFQGTQLVLNTSGNTIVNGSLTTNGKVSITDTTNSTSNTSGAFTVNGGLGVTSDVYLGNNLFINSDIQLSSYNNGLNISSTSLPQLNLSKRNDTSNYNFALNLYNLTSGNDNESLNIFSTNNNYYIGSKISGNGTYKNIILSSNTSSITLSTNGNIGINNNNPLFGLDILGNVNVNGNFMSKSINISNTSANSITTLGGITINKDVNVNQNLIVSGSTLLGNTSTSNLFTINEIVSQNLTVGNSMVINQDLLVKNNFNCNGTLILSNTGGNSVSISGGVSIGRDLLVSGNTNLNGLLNLTNITFPKFKINETMGNFVITNVTTGNNSIVINPSGISLNEPVNVFSDITFNNNIHVKGSSLFDNDISSNGKIILNNTTPSVNSSTGSLIVGNGGMGLNGNLNMNGNFNLIGNLSVTGTVSNINSTNININDNVLLLNAGVNGSRDAGILINRFQTDNDTGLGDVVNDLQFISFTLGSQTGTNSSTIALPSSASSIDNYYNKYWIKVLSGFSNSQVRSITSYNGTTKIATLSSPFTSQNPNSGDIIHLYYKSFVGLIYDEIHDNFALGSLVINPGDAPVEFTSYSSLKLQDATILGNINMNSTENSTSNTTGSLLVSGGASIQKNLYIGSQLVVNNINITPSTGDIIKPIIYNAFNNTVGGTITGLSFGSNTLGVDIYLHATLVTSSNLYGFYHIRLLNKSTTWESGFSVLGTDDLLLNFYIDNSGNVLYTTPNYSGFVSLTFKYKAITV
jgi:hypothetical protein